MDATVGIGTRHHHMRQPSKRSATAMASFDHHFATEGDQHLREQDTQPSAMDPSVSKYPRRGGATGLIDELDV